MQLGQLAAQAYRTVRAKGHCQIIQCAPQFVGGFVEDHRAGLLLQKVQPFPALPFRDRQKPLEHEPCRGLTAGGEGCHAGRSRRHRHYLDAPGVGLFDDLLTGVADAGHSGIAAQGAVFARFDALQDSLTMVERMLIITDHRLF